MIVNTGCTVETVVSVCIETQDFFSDLPGRRSCTREVKKALEAQGVAII